MKAPGRTRRTLALAPVALWAACLAGLAGKAHAATLPAPVSLAAELAQALRAGQPLVVMASLEGCLFCRIVRDEHLAPLRSDAGQPVFQLDMGSAREVLDFKGARTTHDQLLRAWRIGTAPTVLFFGRHGAEAAERLVDSSIPDFYGAYLEERLATARRNLRG